MNTPVLIAARNEAEHIGRTLDALPRRTVEPLVLINGCSDNTSDIAESYGAKVITCPDEGKLPALQAGIALLGHQALEPFITLDADSQPLFSRTWPKAMLNARAKLDTDKPACVVGPSIYNQIGLVSGAIRTAAYWRQQFNTRHDDHEGYFAGRNMLLHFRDQAVLNKALALPHIWPGEDVALKDEVLKSNGSCAKLLSPTVAVVTSGDRYIGVWSRITKGRQVNINWMTDSYTNDAAPGSINYAQFKDELTETA